MIAPSRNQPQSKCLSFFLSGEHVTGPFHSILLLDYLPSLTECAIGDSKPGKGETVAPVH